MMMMMMMMTMMVTMMVTMLVLLLLVVLLRMRMDASPKEQAWRLWLLQKRWVSLRWNKILWMRMLEASGSDTVAPKRPIFGMP